MIVHSLLATGSPSCAAILFVFRMGIACAEGNHSRSRNPHPPNDMNSILLTQVTY
jgi:hypothetical protein